MQSKIFGTHYDFDYLGSNQSIHIAAKAADLTEETIREEIILAAREAGVTDLYLMDRDFLLSAIREKQARQNPTPLTLEELRDMIGQPVWVKVNDVGKVSGAGCWTIVNKALLGASGGFTAYRSKPEEVQK